MIAKLMKSALITIVVSLFVLISGPVFSQATVLDATASDPENIMDVNDAGVTNWKTFETRMFNIVKSTNPDAAQQVSLDVTYPSGTTRIRPDILVKIGNKYRVIDVKTSQKKNLGELPDLSVFCTTNQKTVYPLINLMPSPITKVVVKGTQGAPLGLTDGTTISLEKDVVFYVNASANDFTQYVKRAMIK